jgi:hypothetical protein
MTASDQRAQVFIDSIMSIRHQRIDSLRRSDSLSQAAAQSGTRLSWPVTVVIVPKLDVDGAVAMVDRRPDASPNDVIALQADHVTLGALGAAIAQLVQMRRDAGDSTVSDGHATLIAESTPSSWDSLQRVLMQGELDKLKASSAIDVARFGVVRSREFFVLPTK